MKRLISVLLVTSIYLSIYPPNGMTLHAADAQTDLESIIREQIEAFAKSIDQKDASNSAKKALASHGISGGGKKLSVGKNHALTAVLWNSELMQAFLIHSFAQVLELIQSQGDHSLYIDGRCNYYSSGNFYACLVYDTNGKLLYHSGYVDCRLSNAYDASLTGIGGNVKMKISAKPKIVYKDIMTYDIEVIAHDRFDFHTSGNGGFKDFISGIGTLLFREFDWESKVSFQLTVPNECEHSYQTETTKPTCTAKGYTTYTCTLCGCSYKDDYTEKLSHTYDDVNDASCNLCGELRAVRGDMNGDFKKDAQDALYLLRHVLMPTVYPAAQSADINGDGRTDNMDALYLLRHILLPKAYPLS